MLIVGLALLCAAFGRQLAPYDPLRYNPRDTLASPSAQHLLGTTAPLGKLRGRFHTYQGIPVLCTYHPAFLLPHRQPAKKKDVWDDMQMLLKRMGRPIPKPRGQ